VRQAVVGLGGSIAGEGVGLDDVRAGVQIRGVDGANDLRPGEREQVAVALQLARPVGEALAPPVRLAQVVGLDHGAHRPVEQEDPPSQERLQQRETLGPGVTGSDGGGWWRHDWHERSYEKSPGLKRHGASVLAIV
jgi:hypothetical protein